MLTYYQAVELMSCLPALLSPANDNKAVPNDIEKKSDEQVVIEDLSEMESWYLINRSMTANGEYFAD